MSQELKACPFCGEKQQNVISNGFKNHFVECENCGASGPAGDTEASAIAEWNRRATASSVSPDPRDEVISTAILTEARIHAVEHPSKDIRYFAQCVVEELTKREEVLEKCLVALEKIDEFTEGHGIYNIFDEEFDSPTFKEALAAIKELKK